MSQGMNKYNLEVFRAEDNSLVPGSGWALIVNQRRIENRNSQYGLGAWGIWGLGVAAVGANIMVGDQPIDSQIFAQAAEPPFTASELNSFERGLRRGYEITLSAPLTGVAR